MMDTTPQPQHPETTSEYGASIVEYALLVALIAMACLAAVLFLGEDVDESLDDTSSSLQAT